MRNRISTNGKWASRLAGLVLAVTLAGCGPAAVDGDGSAAGDGPSGEVLVFAAASLTNAFEELREEFVADNPGVAVVFNFAGSQTLASQINEGAPADVFASANQAQMAVVEEAGNLAGSPEVFTANRLAIVVEPGNPLGIAGLSDLAEAGLLVVLPAEEVPAGRYAREALDAAGVMVTPVSLDRDVRAAMSKVELGEADASIVYVSDVVAAGDRVTGIEIPAEHNVPAAYQIARLAGARSPEAAEAFVAFVLSENGQAILADHGFTAP